MNHPRRNAPRLAQYGARQIKVDGRKVIEMRDPNDNTGAVYQYRRTDDDGLESRRGRRVGKEFTASSPWERWSEERLERMRAQRGDYHPVLNPLRL